MLNIRGDAGLELSGVVEDEDGLVMLWWSQLYPWSWSWSEDATGTGVGTEILSTWGIGLGLIVNVNRCRQVKFNKLSENIKVELILTITTT